MKIGKYFAVVALILTSMPCISQVKPHAKIKIDFDKLPKRYEWTKEKWSGDDKPFRLIRNQIDAAIKAGKSPQKLFLEYTPKSWDQEKDPRLVFAWNFALYRCKNSLPTLELQSGSTKAFLDIATLPLPHTYEYMRLRYLLAISQDDPNSFLFKRLGERLIHHNPVVSRSFCKIVGGSFRTLVC